ncbi:hypothetical protein VTO73DRAFT_13388 [Trametes versicolor]
MPLERGYAARVRGSRIEDFGRTINWPQTFMGPVSAVMGELGLVGPRGGIAQDMQHEYSARYLRLGLLCRGRAVQRRIINVFIPIAEVVLYFFDPFFAPLHQFLIPAQLLSPRLPGSRLDDWICNILQVEGASGGPSETDQPTALLRPGSMNVLSDGTSPAVQRSSCPANGERRYMKREGCPRIAFCHPPYSGCLA